MELALACIYCALLAIGLQVLVLRICSRHPAMWQRRTLFRLIALVWSIMPVVKVCYVDPIVPPADSLEHEDIARDIADSLSAGRFGDVATYIAPGNSAYRLLLGTFYFVTGAPEIVVYAVNGALGFVGLLFLIDILCTHANCRRLPTSAVLTIGLLPSALLWTTANLKEGLVLWGICSMLYLTIPARAIGQRTPRVLPFVGLVVVASQRPHIAVAWLVAIAIGTTLQSKRIGLFLGTVGAAVVSIVLLSYVAPDLFSSAMSDGVSKTLGDRYATLSARDGAGGDSLTGANPIPVVSGLLLILFRPWPFEVEESHALLVGLEVWALALIGFLVWKSARKRRQTLLHPAMITQLVALAALGYYFSYMYNLGLVARQRLMCFPAVLFIYFFPLLAEQEHGVRAAAKRAAVPVRRMHRLTNFGQPRPTR